MVKHNLEANSMEECEPCLEIITDPAYTNEVRAFAFADNMHMRSLLEQGFKVSTQRQIMFYPQRTRD